MCICFSQPFVAVEPSVSFQPTHVRMLLLMHFHMWSSFAARKICKTAKLSQTNLNNRMAQLHQTIADQEATVQNALGRVMDSNSIVGNSNNDNSDVTCTVCLEQYQRDDCVRCSRNDNHYHCIKCIDHCAATMLSAQNMQANAFKCLSSCQECSGSIAKSDLMRCEHGERLVQEWYHAESMQKVALIVGNKDHELSMQIRYLRANGTYGAAACPRCGFGPLEHFRCEDLVEFHNKYVTTPKFYKIAIALLPIL